VLLISGSRSKDPASAEQRVTRRNGQNAQAALCTIDRFGQARKLAARLRRRSPLDHSAGAFAINILVMAAAFPGWSAVTVPLPPQNAFARGGPFGADELTAIRP
jgi:hypothetical protein